MQGSLVRPLGGGGALRLASDCAQLEFALSNILGPSGHSALLGPTGLTALGDSYRLLRAFRALLFLTPADMAAYPGTQHSPLTPLEVLMFVCRHVRHTSYSCSEALKCTSPLTNVRNMDYFRRLSTKFLHRVAAPWVFDTCYLII